MLEQLEFTFILIVCAFVEVITNIKDQQCL